MMKRIRILIGILLFILVSPITLFADQSETIITNGDYTISTDGVYQLEGGYSGTITIESGAKQVTIKGTGAESNHTVTQIVVTDRTGDAIDPIELTIEDLNITASDGKHGIDFEEAGDKDNKLIIKGSNTIVGDEGKNEYDGKFAAGIHVPDGAKLTINEAEGGGKLTATGGNRGAGIGGDAEEAGGSITITGGEIIATGGEYGAGIGGGYKGAGGNITITGGEIVATGGDRGAGIGGGCSGAGGSITILGGKITATTVDSAAGIGGGLYAQEGCVIIISGGEITAIGGYQEAGIGGGNFGVGCDITISGGKVTATGGWYGAGIGSGLEGAEGSITISGGEIIATGGPEGAGIGGGLRGSGGDITISGGKITATGSRLAAGIGGGNESAGGNITISGNPAIIATKGEWADNIDNIGNGYNATGNTILKDDSNNDICYIKIKVKKSDSSSTEGIVTNITASSEDTEYPPYTLEKEGEIGFFVQKGGSYSYTVKAYGYSDLIGSEENIGDINIEREYTLKKLVTETQPSIQIDYVNEKLTGFNNGEDYTINGITVNRTEGAILIDSSWLGADLAIVKKGNGTTTTDSQSQTLSVPARPGAPNTPIGVNESYPNAGDGKVTGVDPSMEYSMNQNNWHPISGTEIIGISSGTYYVRNKAIQVDGSKAFSSEIKTVSVGMDSATPEAQPSIQIDYVNEKLIGFDNGEDYTINGVTVKRTGGAIEIDSDWFGTELSIIKNGNGTTTTDSELQSLSISARPNAPLSPTGINETSQGVGDGRIIGLDSSMEYSTDRSTWTSVSGSEITGLSSDTYYVRKKATTEVGNEAFTSEYKAIIISADVQETGTVSGKVTDETDTSMSGASIKLTKQGTQGVAIYTQTTDAQGDFTVSDVPYGVYSLVVEKDGKTITKTIIINQPTITQNVVMLSGKKNTVVEVKENTPAIAVDNLNNMFTDADNAEATTNTVEIKLMVEEKNESNVVSSEKTEIQAKVTTGKKVGIYLDAKLLKTVGSASAQAIQPPEGQKITITIDLPVELQNKAPYEIIRVHNNVAVRFPATYNAVLQTLTFEADKFSTYAIAYTDSTTRSSSSNDHDYYTITATAEDGGTISPEGKINIREYNDDKTFKITPQEGYIIEDVLVDGNSVGAVESYTFKGIRRAHTIKAVFAMQDSSVQNPFVDIHKEDWYYEAVLNSWARGIMNGTSDTTFGPKLHTTRGMIATIIYRLDQSDEKVENLFTDVAKDKYYYDAIGWGEENGILKGYGDGTFGPTDTITREQLAAILYRYSAESKSFAPSNTGLSKFTDEKDISEYARPALAWAYERGIINGKGNNILDPQGLATRAEVAKVIMNYMNLKEK